MISKLTPLPKAKQLPTNRSLHGVTLKDEFSWLQERDNPEVIAYLEAENAYTQKVMAPTQQLQESLFEEMLARIQETDTSYPVKRGEYFYYTRTEKGLSYPIYCRKRDIENAAEEILLELNELAKDKAYLSLGAFAVSTDHRLLAYALDDSGAEVYTVYVKNLETGELLKDRIQNAATSLVWAEDNTTVFYSTLDETHRPDKIWRHALGQRQEQDVCVYHDPDGAFFVGAGRTKDRKFLIISSESKTSSEQWYCPADQPDQDFKLIQKRQAGLEYGVEHHQGYWYVLSNLDAVNFCLKRTELTKPQKAYWQDVIEHRPDVKLEDIEIFEKFMVVLERDQGQLKIRYKSWDADAFSLVEFPDSANTVWFESNPEYKTDELMLGYTSLVRPRSVYLFDMVENQLELKKQQVVQGDFVAEEYASKRIMVKTPSGVSVPISLVYKKALRQSGPQPCMLYGYGSYGISMDPAFSSQRLSLLDRGFVFAIAHIRGGGDLGRPWYEDGKWLNKKNTFDDFIACAEYLIAEEWTSPQYLSMSGGSAGGLLMGAVVNQRPELFRAVVMDVPFVDVLNTMLDPSLPLTVSEYEEWGNPEEEQYFHYIRSYSPYDQIKAQNYPHMLVTGGLNDPRVQYWEPAKWTARLRNVKTDNNVLILKMEMDYGHGGASGRYDFLKEIAFEYAFLLLVYGLDDAPTP